MNSQEWLLNFTCCPYYSSASMAFVLRKWYQWTQVSVTRATTATGVCSERTDHVPSAEATREETFFQLSCLCCLLS